MHDNPVGPKVPKTSAASTKIPKATPETIPTTKPETISAMTPRTPEEPKIVGYDTKQLPPSALEALEWYSVNGPNGLVEKVGPIRKVKVL
ncbi:hypothetical protein E4U32_002234 [Claviceps aff. humidiphila group G2b]|nr:hypothetical protein E4U32_002234 [Claviceps aff. humidiphila group G2b]